jgi:hypothetical protein
MNARDAWKRNSVFSVVAMVILPRTARNQPLMLLKHALLLLHLHLLQKPNQGSPLRQKNSPQDSARSVGCIDPDRASMEVRLNTSALSDPNSLIPSVTIDTFLNISPFPALVDSGSTHCFIDSCFVSRYDIPTYPVSPIQLRLFDGTLNSVITAAIDLPICFTTGDVTSAMFYVTPLDSSCFIVLGYNWLTRHNPLIDWVLSSIAFHPPSQGMPSTPMSPQLALAAEEPLDSPGPSPGITAPSITLINAVAFAYRYH